MVRLMCSACIAWTGSDAIQTHAAVVLHTLRKAGGRLVSATENIESGALGDFMRAALSLASALEVERNRERTARWNETRYRQAGRYKPTKKPVYGYRRMGRGVEATYEVDATEAQVLQRVFTERARGASLRTIISGLTRDGIPSPAGKGSWGASRRSTRY